MRRAIAALTLAALALSACGKFGGPSPVGPADQITYPKNYPTH